MNQKLCQRCDAVISTDAPGELCPACVLRDAVELTPESPDAPSLTEIAAAFPSLEVLSYIGQGGMGFVYKVRQPELDRTAALKILSPALGNDPAFAERFAREARVLGKLQHPNIVTIFESGEQGGYFYLLMEFIDGVNLRQAMQTERFTPEQALAVVPGICDALQAAHAKGIWHRDIKPENILLDKEGNIKIVDFGIARLVGDPQQNFTLTLAGHALGSTAYMAPEQHENPHEVDHRADIYSLGVVIYELLTGELPLGRFPSPGQRAEVDARIDEIVLKTLEKERSLRHQSATEVKTDFSTAPSHQPCKDAPSSASISPQKFFQNPQKMFLTSLGLWLGGWVGILIPGVTSPMLLTMGALAVFFGLIGSGWILWKIRHQSHPPEHRLPLLILVFWPTAIAAALGPMQLWFALNGIDGGKEPDGLPILMPSVYALFVLILPLIITHLLWRFFGRQEQESNAKKWKVFLAILLVIAGTIMEHYDREQRTIKNTSYGLQVRIRSDAKWSEEISRYQKLLDEITLSGQAVRARLYEPLDPEMPESLRRESRAALTLEWRSPSRSAANEVRHRYLDNLEAGIPQGDRLDGIRFGHSSDFDWGYQDKIIYYVIGFIPFLIPFGLIALLTTGRWMGVGITSVVGIGMVAVLTFSKWPSMPADALPSAPPVEKLPALTPPRVDYTTTRDAIESHIKMAKENDLASFEIALSTRLIDMVAKSHSDCTSVMKIWRNFTYQNQITSDDKTARVKLKNKSNSQKFEAHLVKFERNWQIDSLYPIPQGQTPLQAGQVVIEAAKNKDVLRFMNGLSIDDQEKIYVTDYSEASLLEGMEFFAQLNLLKVEPIDDSTAWVEMSHKLIPEMKGRYQMGLIKGEWRFNGKREGFATDSIVETIEKIMSAAHEKDLKKFRLLLSSNYIEKHPDLTARMMNLSRYKIKSFSVSSDEDQQPDLVLQTFDGSNREKTYLLIKEEGQWKFDGEAPQQ